MDNQNQNPNIEGFDEITPAEKPVLKESAPKTEPASYTPAPSSASYMPMGSYSNGSDQAPSPETVYIRKPPKEKSKKVGVSIVGFVSVILVAAIIGASSCLLVLKLFPELISKNESTSHLEIPGTITVNDSTVESVVEAVYQKASPSIVGIRTTVGVKNFFLGESETSGEGTGIIYSKDGYIITCYHVISNIYNSSVTSAKIEVFLPDDPETAIEAKVVGYNKATDIALIKINEKNLTPAEFSSSSEVKVGQFAVVIGNPGGLQFMSSVSYGVVSGVNRSMNVEGIGDMALIQTDAAINPGNSGGALVNTEGKVIGVNSSKLVSDDIEGMGFAIPIDNVLEIVKNIIENKDTPQPYTGIELYHNITGEWLEENGLPKGVVVKNIAGSSPAYYAGLASGDIIVAFNGAEIESIEDYTTEFKKCKPNQKVDISIYRNGRYYSGTITIGSNNAVEY